MTQEIILYDLPSKAPSRSWSGNAWKTRLALNFKNVPYKTTWVPFTRVQDTIKSFGLKPNPPGSWTEYSIPTVQFADGSYVMDSAAIALEIEARYPTPSLRLNSTLEEEAQGAIGALFFPLAPYIMSHGADIVSPEDLEWFKADRAKRFGMTIEEAFETPKDGAPFFAAAEPGFKKCAEVLRNHKVDQGPFILGSEPSYADFILVAITVMFERIGGVFFQEFTQAAPREIMDLHEASRKWTGKQD